VNDTTTDVTALDPQTAARIAEAPLPTRSTLRRRRSLVLQTWRFALLNLKMLRMVRKGH
jgi:hypothetical protein